MIKVLKQALEFIERINKDGWILADFEPQMYDTITSLNQAIKELESQEPVALFCCGYTDANAVKWNPLNGVVQCHNCGQNYTPPQRTEGRVCCQQYDIFLEPCTSRGRHLAQRTWVGLTDEDISKISQRLGIDHDDSWTDLKQAIEAKLKERNT